MKSLRLLLFQLVFLLGFCFKNLDLSTIQLAHLDFSVTTLFVIITLSILFLTTYFKALDFKALDFIELFDSILILTVSLKSCLLKIF